MRAAVVLALATLLGGCVSMDPGWQGTGAQPFDQAKADCEQEAAGMAFGDARESAFEACMASKGWNRPV